MSAMVSGIPLRLYVALVRFFKRRSRRHFVLSLLATTVALVLSFVLAYVWVLREVQYELAPPPLQGSPANISLLTQYIEVNPTAGHLTADWFPIPDCLQSEAIINIYFDRNLLVDSDTSDSIPSINPSDVPVFQVNTTQFCRDDVKSSAPIFRTVMRLIAYRNGKQFNSASLQSYPFDTYFAPINAWAQLNGTNTSVVISENVPFGTPVNFNINLDKEESTNTGELILVLNITRSASVKTLVIFILLANWIVSIAFLWITTAALIWPEEIVKEMFVVPVAALFAFTSVRSNLPGAPAGFGAYIDFVGILPNIALMTFSSAILLIAVLVRRTRKFDHQGSSGGKPLPPDSTDLTPSVKDNSAFDTLPITNSPVGPRRNETMRTIPGEFGIQTDAHAVVNHDAEATPLVPSTEPLAPTADAMAAIVNPVPVTAARAQSMGPLSSDSDTPITEIRFSPTM